MVRRAQFGTPSDYSDADARTAVEGDVNLEDLASQGSAGQLAAAQGDGTVALTDPPAGGGTSGVITQPRVDYGTITEYLVGFLYGDSGVQYRVTDVQCRVVGGATPQTDITLIAGDFDGGGPTVSVNGNEQLTTADAALPITLGDGVGLDVLVSTSAVVEDVLWGVKYEEV